MMVETILDSSPDFGMSNGVLPQWKRELLQRRAARSRPPAPLSCPAPPPAPPPPEEDEELRYGPGIVKRLKSRYLSLALRDAPRRRPSVLRRAASLEHLLDERPPPAPRPQRQRPVSLAPSCPAVLPPRRDSVKRARSVDALSRLEAREEPPPSPPPPPPAPPIAPRPPTIRNARPPRRPAPLLRETERPPPDVVKSTLRKFESAPSRRTPPAARVSAVLRGFANSTEPRDRSLSPPVTDVSSFIDEPESPQATKTVSRAALDGIAQAGSTVRYSFETPKRGSHLPLVSASNPVLLGISRLSPSPRRVGVIRPMPAPTLERSVSTPAPLPEDIEKIDVPRIVTPPPSPIVVEPETPKEKKETPSALVEPIPRSPPEEPKETIRLTPPREFTPEPQTPKEIIETKPEFKLEELKPDIIEKSVVKPELNGHAESQKKSLKTWKSVDVEKKEPKENGEVKSWIRGGSPAAARRGRVPAPAATSVVFNFSARKEVPDYIENDGIILRNKRDKIKASDPGVVVLRPEALVQDSDSDEPDDCGPPSPLAVRFINDNVLINGRSSMPHKPDKTRTARLKIQFDDSLTRTFEYPSETSLCEDAPSPAASPAPANTPPQAHQPALAANTHIASAALSRYTPHKTLAATFQLGVTRQEETHTVSAEECALSAEEEAQEARCAADCARSWSETRTHATDLLFFFLDILRISNINKQNKLYAGVPKPTNKTCTELGPCEVCDANEALYTCPKCEVKTCCLKCVRIHKTELKCDGIRDRTKFIRVKDFTDRDLLSDYRLLEECARFVYGVKKDEKKRFTRIDKDLPIHLFKLKMAARDRGVALQFLAQNFSRHSVNTTRYNYKTNLISWRVEWIFPNAEPEMIKFVDEKCLETKRLSELLEKYLDLNVEPFEGSKALTYYKSVGFNGVKVLLRAEKVKGCSRKFFELDPSESLAENLSGKCIVEFPLVFVVLKDHAYNFDIITPEDEFEEELPATKTEAPVSQESQRRKRPLLTEKVAVEKQKEIQKEIQEDRKKKPKNLLFTTGYSSEESLDLSDEEK